MSTSTITPEGDVRLPVRVADATGLRPGVEIDIEVTDSGVLVRPAEVAEREDVEDAEAANAALGELEQGAASVPWRDVKRDSGL